METVHGKEKSATAWPAPRFPGKTFVLESTVPAVKQFKRFMKRVIEEEGGRLASSVTESVDYLLTIDQRGNRKSADRKRAKELNRKGAAIQFLDVNQFFMRLLPTQDEALILLQSGERGCNRWRMFESHWNAAQTTYDFNGIDLRGKDLSECNFCAAVFTGADLRNTDLTGCNLGRLKDTRFDGARLHEAHFSEASRCSFKKADLTEAHINPAEFTSCDFTGAIMRELSGRFSQMTDCVFRQANLREARLEESKLRHVDFTGADLSGAHLSKCDFTGVKLTGAKLVGADLTDAVLAEADLSKADLTDAVLVNADLTGATIDGARFTGATLTGLQYGNTDPARATGLDLSQAVIGGKIGPNIRQLEDVAGQSQRLQTQAIITLRGKSIALGLTSHRNSRLVGTVMSDQTCSLNGFSQSLSSGMIEVTKKFNLGQLRLDTVTVKCSKGPMKSGDLQELAVRAWCEAIGVEPPSLEALRQTLGIGKYLRAKYRDELLELLKTGSKGVKRWNELVAGIPQPGLGSDMTFSWNIISRLVHSVVSICPQPSWTTLI